MHQGKPDPISQHIFLLPFKILDKGDPSAAENGGGSSRKGIRTISRLDELEACFPLWESKSYSIDGFKSKKKLTEEEVRNEKRRRYTEHQYFYDHVQDLLYPPDPLDNESYTRYLLRDEFRNTKVVLRKQVFEGGLPEDYHLILDHLALRLFASGVCILAIELLNYDHAGFDSITKINELGRRLYPQYLLTSDTEHFCKDGLQGNDGSLKYLPRSVMIGSKKFELCPEDAYLGREIPYLPSWIRFLLFEKSDTSKEPDTSKDAVTHLKRYIPLIDDRMFVCAYAGNQEFSELIHQQHRLWWDDTPPEPEAWRLYAETWHKLIFIDSTGLSCQNAAMLASILREATHSRWSGYGTLYGASRYSFIAMANWDKIRQDMEGVYYQMATLALAQRATIQLFSDRITALSRKMSRYFRKDAESDPDEMLEEAEKLNGDYLVFTSQMWMTEVTAQEQGIDLFALMQKQMALKEQFEELRDEIKDLYESVDLLTQKLETVREKEETATINNLTKISAVFLPISLAVSLWQVILGIPEVTGTPLIALLGSLTVISALVVLGFTDGLWHYLIKKQQSTPLSSKQQKPMKGENGKPETRRRLFRREAEPQSPDDSFMQWITAPLREWSFWKFILCSSPILLVALVSIILNTNAAILWGSIFLTILLFIVSRPRD